MSILDRFRIDGKVAIVTGAGRGIGAACARALAEAGANVVLGARTAEQLDDVSAAVSALGRTASTVVADLSERAGMEALVAAAAAEFGGVDIVVNNVGGALPSAFHAIDEAAFSDALHFNVTTAFNLTQLALPSMIERGGGSVVNIASTAGQFSSRGFTPYGTAKAALVHLTKATARDLAPKVRVNAVSPGATATSALDVVVNNEELHAAMVAGTPLRRLGDPEDVAAAVLYLASPAAAYVTGEVLAVSGGITGSTLDMGIPDY